MAALSGTFRSLQVAPGKGRILPFVPVYPGVRALTGQRRSVLTLDSRPLFEYYQGGLLVFDFTRFIQEGCIPPRASCEAVSGLACDRPGQVAAVMSALPQAEVAWGLCPQIKVPVMVCHGECLSMKDRARANRNPVITCVPQGRITLSEVKT